jgi:ABC-type lipoprotein export system ATPase subunit/sugar-specific transcriptional regulator TrmB
MANQFDRGSEWRQWDLHVHSPASFHWKGDTFTGDTAADAALVDKMILAMNAATPAVFALMDYWTFEGWFALQKRLMQPGAPKLLKTVLPGIELRLCAPAKCRLNAHVVFSDLIATQALIDFRAALKVEIIDRPLSDPTLMALARKVAVDKLSMHGFKKADVDGSDATALRAGATMAEINADSYKDAIRRVPDAQAIGFMPFDTSDGLAEVKWQDHYAYFLSLFTSSPIFESRNIELRSAFVGEKTAANAAWFENFQIGLNDIPRLVVAGSDAHRLSDYGKFPSDKCTWIKADPTFRGLQQAIKEPGKRSFIGQKPPKLYDIEQNRTYYIDSVDVQKKAGSALTSAWLQNTTIKLNPDLVAIIGNKGSGKSALADVIALLGNSKQAGYFSFLKKDRFRGKSGEPAKQFLGELWWADGSKEQRCLADNPPPDKVQMVRYIPQGHFEDLCNDHVSGNTGAFERELRAVIFDHASDAIRLGALDFEQLIEQQETGFRDQLGEHRKDLSKVNRDIESAENQRQPQVRSSLQELLVLKCKQLDEHNALKPPAAVKPSSDLSEEQQKASAELDLIAKELKSLEQKSASRATNEASFAAKTKAIQLIRDRIRLFEKQYKQLREETAKHFEGLGTTLDQMVSLSVSDMPLVTIANGISSQQAQYASESVADTERKTALLAAQATHGAKLNEPQQKYQQSLAQIAAWNEKLATLRGTTDAPETLRGIEERIKQLDELPVKLDAFVARRLVLSREIFDTLDAQRSARAALFKPVQDLIQSNALIREEYQLQFQAALGGSSDAIATELFTLVKQNAGEFRGEDESFAVLRALFEEFNVNKRDEALAFASKLDEKLHLAAAGGDVNAVGIGSVLRRDRTASQVYDLIFGLKYLEPRYSLLFQNTPIEQLSPGQRGALLLIFYLLVDKGRNPIILDQPEENLDNETVVNLLVPVVTEAKKKRQLIMVTHNPNLAVVCDAEQVIYAAFDRKSGARISYESGSIEHPAINRHVVNVLEGTMRAFNNRKIKYH